MEIQDFLIGYCSKHYRLDQANREENIKEQCSGGADYGGSQAQRVGLVFHIPALRAVVPESCCPLGFLNKGGQPNTFRFLVVRFEKAFGQQPVEY